MFTRFLVAALDSGADEMHFSSNIGIIDILKALNNPLEELLELALACLY